MLVCVVDTLQQIRELGDATSESDTNILDVVGEQRAVELSYGEDEPEAKRESTGYGYDDDGSGRQQDDPTLFKRSSLHDGLRKSSRRARRRRSHDIFQPSVSIDDSDSDNDNFLAPLLENEIEQMFGR